MIRSSYLSKLFIRFIFLFTLPALMVYPHDNIPFDIPCFSHEMKILQSLLADNEVLYYDKILQLIEKIENDELEEKYNIKCLEKINYFLAYLAKNGILSEGSEKEKVLLEKDIQLLLDISSGFQKSSYSYRWEDCYKTIPAVFSGQGDILLCKSWFSKQWKHTKKFVKKHKKGIIIGTAFVTAAVIIIVSATTAAPATAAALGAAATTPSSSKNTKKKPSASSGKHSTNNTATITDNPFLLSDIGSQVTSLQDMIIQSNFTIPDNENMYLSEEARILGSTLAHERFSEVFLNSQPTSSLTPEYEQIIMTERNKIDKVFDTDHTMFYLNKENASYPDNFTEDLHYLHGQSAFAQDRYEESIYDFNKVLQINPYNKNVYLDRSCTYLAMGKYEEAVNDYNTYIAQNPRFDVTDFSIGFIKGFPKGAIESGHQLFTFASECITHPIATGKSICEAISTLVQMSASQEWKTIAETLVPEVTELIKEWNMLTPQEQGEKAGYVFAKIGGDFFLPGAACKIMANGVKGAKEIAVITRNLKKAEKTLVLDALNQSASAPMKFAEATSQLEKIEKKFPKIKIQEILNQIEEQINNSSLKITGFTEHGLERMLSRGINPTSVIDALKNPIQINAIKWDYLGRPSQRFIGEKVEVVINPQTKKILSVNSTSSKKLNKILKKAKND